VAPGEGEKGMRATLVECAESLLKVKDKY